MFISELLLHVLYLFLHTHLTLSSSVLCCSVFFPSCFMPSVFTVELGSSPSHCCLVSAPDPTDAAADGLHHCYASLSCNVIHPQLRPLSLGLRLILANFHHHFCSSQHHRHQVLLHQTCFRYYDTPWGLLTRMHLFGCFLHLSIHGV